MYCFETNGQLLPIGGNLSLSLSVLSFGAYLQNFNVCQMRFFTAGVYVKEKTWRNAEDNDVTGLWEREKGWEGWREDDRGADWSKGLLSPPAMPYVQLRPNPFGVLTRLMREYTSQNALYLCIPQSHFMSGVHLFCIKVSGKDATGVSRLACSSLNGYHQMRASGAGDMADVCIFYWSTVKYAGCGCTAGWHDTPGSQSKPEQNKQRQST